MGPNFRAIGVFLLGLLWAGLAAAQGELQVEIHEPADGALLSSLDSQVEVVGGASIFGGVKQLDLFLVLDTSKSLHDTDPKDYRVKGSVALVRSLPAKSDIQVGVVDVDGNAELIQPLTADRSRAVAALRDLDRHGSTNLAAGIRAALAGFHQNARPGSSRVMLLFTDGKSNEKKARAAMAEARAQGVAIHTLLLGKDSKGTEILRGIAAGTGGSFVRVVDPAKLPEAFLNLKTTGVEKVTLSVNGGSPLPATLSGGTFSGSLPLVPGPNRIVAVATSLDGERREATTTVVVSDELTVRIETPGEGTLYTERETETTVTGTATLFDGMSEAAIASHPDHGVQSVLLRVDDSPAFVTTVENGRFSGRVLLHDGENRIVATATGVDGRVAEAVTLVTVRAPGCAELSVQAYREGQPAISLSDRGIEIVFDASNSMWAQIDGRSKMEIAKESLEQTLDALPAELGVALRVYGHQHKRELRRCDDSQLLVSFDSTDRDGIRRAIAGVKPRGQTPLGHSLEQVGADFGDFVGERAVVLVTDGLESCGGDPVAAAKLLHEQNGVTVHVIGFGLGSAEDEDVASLRAIAHASGGRFVSAGSAAELRDALSTTVGTAFRVTLGGWPVVEGSLGAGDRFRLPEGEYVVEFDSQPARKVPVRLVAEEAASLLVNRRGDELLRKVDRGPAEYAACAEPDPRTSPAAID
jgi:Mg-chelatase subunit ChlD